MVDVIVVGGGASGLVAAITAARRGYKVTILERMDRIGKKILATGNGRCNLMNMKKYPYLHNNDFAQNVIVKYGISKQTKFWSDSGLFLRNTDQSLVYPSTLQASTVLDILRNQIELLSIRVICDTEVQDIQKTKNGFALKTNHDIYLCQKLILSGGGMSQAKLGSNGSAIKILSRMGHSVRECTPALTQLICDMKDIKGLSGLKTKALFSMYCADQCVYQESGEILFTDYGLSGVCVMNASGFYQRGNTSVALNLLENQGNLDRNSLRKQLIRRCHTWQTLGIDHLWIGIFPPRIGLAVMKQSNLQTIKTIAELTPRLVDRIVHTTECFQIKVIGIRGFEYSQVTSGGVCCSEVDYISMESKIIPGLFITGQTLDVDGICGGYNLMFAFASGMAAGEHVGG